MYVTYFDEVKANLPQGQIDYRVGGIVVPVDQISAFEAKVNALSQELFKTNRVDRSDRIPREMHLLRYVAFSRWKIEWRLDVFVRMLDIRYDGKLIKFVFAAIDTTKLYNADYAPEYAFAHFCEGVGWRLKRTSFPF